MNQIKRLFKLFAIIVFAAFTFIAASACNNSALADKGTYVVNINYAADTDPDTADDNQADILDKTVPFASESAVTPDSGAAHTPIPQFTPKTIPPVAPEFTSTPVPTPVPSPSMVPTDEPGGQKPMTSPDPDADRTVYLTFDDGPCKLTYELLDILDRYNIKVTFFTVGYFVDRYPEIIREAEARGHLIACHTYSHDYSKLYESADAFMNDIYQWEDAVKRALGHLPEQVIIRFPGGSSMSGLSDKVRQQILQRLKAEGYRWFDWNCGNNDAWPAGNKNGLPIEKYLMNSYLTTIKWAFGKSKPCIFLAHDTNKDTINMITGVIEDLISRGAEFRTLLDCP